MIKLFDSDTEAEIGEISEDQLSFMMEHLVEETLDEFSWNLDPPAINSLESSGAEPALVALLRRALGSRTSMEVRYEPE